MHTPYTDDYTRAVAVATECVAASLAALLWARPLSRRASNALFASGVGATALYGVLPELARTLPGIGRHSLPAGDIWLQLAASLATLGLFLSRPPFLGWLALVGQLALLALGEWLVGSHDELMFTYFVWYGALLGAHQLAADRPPRPSGRPPRLSYPVQDAVIFLVTVGLSAYVCSRVFEYVIYNGDEVAYTFQANVYSHLRAYAPIPPCPHMFENYWVFRHDGRAFSQYTPGWPFFMAPFDRLGMVWLAGPVMGGLVAVGVARLSRRLAQGFGASYDGAERILACAGPLGAAAAMLGPSMLLNAASRFSHTMVAGCFAWAVECAAVLCMPGITRGRSVVFGLGLGLSTALGLATRPADGGFLGVGVFVYFVQALARRRVRWEGFLATSLAFALVGGLTLVILRLQLGVWGKTAYSLAPSIHPEAAFILSFPQPSELKFGIPLATGAYTWWPAAPALATVGLLRALGGRGRGTAFMLVVSSVCLLGFYSFVDFGRHGDDALGPRYVLPTVIAQAAGTGAALASPLSRAFARLAKLDFGRLRHLHELGPALVMCAAAAAGTWSLAGLTYPVAYAESHASTGPQRAARSLKLKHALVLIHPEDAVQGWANLDQNPPMDPNPDVLFLARLKPEDEVCAARHFPGRTWYRAHVEERLTRIEPPAH